MRLCLISLTFALAAILNIRSTFMDELQLKNLPDSGTLNTIISELRNCDLSRVTYQKVFFTLLTKFKLIPVTSALLKAGHHVERARINESNQIFYSEKDISYRTDFKNITKFGRANFPGQSLFYGAIKSQHIEHPRIINLLETSEILRSADKTTDTEFTITVGKWRILQDIEVMENVFSKHTILTMPQVKDSYEHHLNNAKADMPDRIEDVKFVLEFFSDEFAKKEIKTNDDYKISVAYTELAINYRGLAGVTYPSVRTDYQGFNVALTIPVVEQFLQLEVVAMCICNSRAGYWRQWAANSIQLQLSGDGILISNKLYIQQ